MKYFKVLNLTLVLRAGTVNLFDEGARHPCGQDALLTERAHASHLYKRKEATTSGSVGLGSEATGRSAPSDGFLGRILLEPVAGGTYSIVAARRFTLMKTNRI